MSLHWDPDKVSRNPVTYMGDEGRKLQREQLKEMGLVDWAKGKLPDDVIWMDTIYYLSYPDCNARVKFNILAYNSKDAYIYLEGLTLRSGNGIWVPTEIVPVLDSFKYVLASTPSYPFIFVDGKGQFSSCEGSELDTYNGILKSRLDRYLNGKDFRPYPSKYKAVDFGDGVIFTADGARLLLEEEYLPIIKKYHAECEEKARLAKEAEKAKQVAWKLKQRALSDARKRDAKAAERAVRVVNEQANYKHENAKLNNNPFANLKDLLK